MMCCLPNIRSTKELTGMSCSGKSRGTAGGPLASPRTQASQSGAHDAGVTFEYVGTTGLTAVGSVTKRVYLFTEPGMRVTADRRDALSLLAVPLLRQIR